MEKQIKNYRAFENNIHASGLPKRKEIKYLQQVYGIKMVIDLSNRKRQIVENACRDFSLQYIKIPINEGCPEREQIKLALIFLKFGNCLIHCYRGIHRTGIILQLAGLEKCDNKKFKNHKKLLELL